MGLLAQTAGTLFSEISNWETGILRSTAMLTSWKVHLTTLGVCEDYQRARRIAIGYDIGTRC